MTAGGSPSPARVALLTTLAMLAFAGNSLLCRAALHGAGSRIDAATFTLIRIAAGAVALWLIVRLRDGRRPLAGNWPSAFALFAYAAAFSYAYVGLTAATGALLLFGAVQATMIGTGLARGERLAAWQWVGLAAALAGLVALLLPGLAAPPPREAALMLAAGVAWGVYSLRGRGGGDALRITAGNFLRAVAFAVLLAAATWHGASIDAAGIAYAVASGALASGVGYAVWYSALPALKAASAATVQLTVPVIAAVGGIVLLGEPASLRFVLAAAAVLGGIALVVRRPRR